jgi:hypothetical protein
MSVLRKLGMQLLTALLTEKFLKKLIVFLLKKLSERTDNTIDDEVVKMIEKALEPQDPK